MIYKSRVKLALIAISTLSVFGYFPACFVYLISPQQWWFMGILSIGFAYLWVSILFLVICWAFVNRKTALIFLILLLAGIPIMKNVFAFRKQTSFNLERPVNQLRIMQWNCNGLQGNYPGSPLVPERANAVAFIKKYNPDFICFQDFADIKGGGYLSNLSLLVDSLGYRFFIYKQHYKSVYPDSALDGIGIAVFSRHPFADTGMLRYPGREYPETILWADFQIRDRKVRVATTHFQSMHLTRNKDFPLGHEFWQDSAIINQGTKLEKLRNFQPYHVTEAKYLRGFTDTCSFPFILTCDLNSVPSSFVYNVVKGNMQDAFLEKGFGFGKTYHSWQPAIRIDYIFHNKGVVNQQMSIFRTSASDHDPILMDFIIP